MRELHERTCEWDDVLHNGKREDDDETEGWKNIRTPFQKCHGFNERQQGDRMNITGIEWTDRTVNPWVGCPHGCAYCYARRLAKRQRQRCQLCYQFVTHPHMERLDQITPRQKPKKIFIDSMWDWNADGIPMKDLLTIIEKMRECSQHTFQILSKRPDQYYRFTFPENVWLGTSVSGESDNYRIYGLYDNTDKKKNIRFVSAEPLHGSLRTPLEKNELDWVIIGAETGNRKGKIVPRAEWVEDIIDNCRAEKIPIFIKENVGWPKKIQEFP